VAREHGVALSRDDPILATMFLNLAILGRVLDQAVAPAVQAIAETTREAVAHLREHAEAQAPGGSSRSRSKTGNNLPKQQKALMEGWLANMG